MLLIVGTIPIADFPLTLGEVEIKENFLEVENKKFPATQGTGACIAASATTLSYLKAGKPRALLAGDIGDKTGSNEIYDFLAKKIETLKVKTLVLHYIMPLIEPMKILVKRIKKISPSTKLIADAGGMYAVKGTGLSSEFDLFTPDYAEIAFLADSKATHPAYLKRWLFETSAQDIPKLLKQAYKNRFLAKTTLVKGKTDYVFKEGEILATIDEPDIPPLEAIGGTGDTITGMASALIHVGMEPWQASLIALKANREAGRLIKADPATRISKIVDAFPQIFKEKLCQWSGICAM